MLLRRNKLPMSLIQDGTATKASGKTSSLTSVEPFAQTFGPGSKRKRPRLDAGSSSFADLATSSEEAGKAAEERQKALRDKAAGVGLVPADAEIGATGDLDDIYSMPVTRGRSEPAYSKGQSRRIWAELYKVIDSSDVVVHVLDVRDPLGTRCRSVEKHLRDEKPHKHLIFLLNKVDLVPTWVTVSFLTRDSDSRAACHFPGRGQSHWRTYPTFLSRPALLYNDVFGLLRMWKINGTGASASSSWHVSGRAVAHLPGSSPAIEELACREERLLVSGPREELSGEGAAGAFTSVSRCVFSHPVPSSWGDIPAHLLFCPLYHIGTMGQDSLPGISHDRVPCLCQQLVRQGLFDPASTPI